MNSESGTGTCPQDVRDTIAQAVGKLGKIEKRRISFVTTRLEQRDNQHLLLNSFYKLAEDMEFTGASTGPNPSRRGGGR